MYLFINPRWPSSSRSVVCMRFARLFYKSRECFKYTASTCGCHECFLLSSFVKSSSLARNLNYNQRLVRDYCSAFIVKKNAVIGVVFNTEIPIPKLQQTVFHLTQTLNKVHVVCFVHRLNSRFLKFDRKITVKTTWEQFNIPAVMVHSFFLSRRQIELFLYVLALFISV